MLIVYKILGDNVLQLEPSALSQWSSQSVPSPISEASCVGDGLETELTAKLDVLWVGVCCPLRVMSGGQA